MAVIFFSPRPSPSSSSFLQVLVLKVTSRTAKHVKASLLMSRPQQSRRTANIDSPLPPVELSGIARHFLRSFAILKNFFNPGYLGCMIRKKCQCGVKKNVDWLRPSIEYVRTAHFCHLCMRTKKNIFGVRFA